MYVLWIVHMYLCPFQKISNDYVCCRSYLILRPKSKSDPDPDLATVLLFIWPWMFLITLADLILLAFIAGLTGVFIFPALLLCFGVNYVVIKIICREIGGRGDIEGQVESGLELEVVSEKNGERSQSEEGSEEKDVKEKKNLDETPESFHAVAALCATWLPSVVGDQRQKLFLVCGVTSLATKLFVLVLAVVLSGSGLQPHIYERPFLLACVEEHSQLLNQTGITRCKFSEDNCLSNKNLTLETKIADAHSALREAVLRYEHILKSTANETEQQHIKDFLQDEFNFVSDTKTRISGSKKKIKETFPFAGKGTIQQKVRVCEVTIPILSINKQVILRHQMQEPKYEIPFRLIILNGLLVVVMLAAYATYRLHKIADFQVL